MSCQSTALQSPERLRSRPGPPADASAEDADHLVKSPNRTRSDDDSDRELIRRISCADRAAFQQLYTGYYPRLARFLTRVMRRHEDLEEVINDTFLIVWQRAGDYRGASRVSTWILGIAYRRALKFIRRSASWSRAASLALHSGEAVVEDTAGVMEDRQLLDLALARLPPEQRLVLLLAYRMDYSCEEIAEIAECPVNTVKSRMFHARRKLRTILSAAAAPRAAVGS
jgi:RNA polymerase sigma-70 factor (ECF subfamily)